MTKKVEEVVVPEEEINFGGNLVAAEPADFSDIPFLNKKNYSSSRPYRNDLNGDPVIEIAGRTIVSRDVDRKEAIELGLPGVMGIEQNNVLLGRVRGMSKVGSGYWGTHHALKSSDVKYKHIDLNGTDIYISNGSRLIISENFNNNEYDDSVTINVRPKLILMASELSVKSLTLAGKVSLENSSIKGDSSYLVLIDSKIYHSTVGGEFKYPTIDKSAIYNSYLLSNHDLTVVDSDLTCVTIIGMKGITIERVSGGYDFRLSNSSSPSLPKFSVKIVNQYLHPADIANYGIGDKNYENISDNPYHIEEYILNIERRIDYGTFAGSQPIPFIRLNQCDILVGCEIFSVKDFFPEMVTKQEAPKLPMDNEYRPAPWQPGYGFLSSPNIGTHSRNSPLWQKAALVAFSKNKAVIGKVGETLVNSLLDQIRSRINIYVELSTIS